MNDHWGTPCAAGIYMPTAHALWHRIAYKFGNGTGARVTTVPALMHIFFNCFTLYCGNDRLQIKLCVPHLHRFVHNIIIKTIAST
jgi:hypothetical protein